MLKRRIIPIELLSGGRLVKTVCFDSPRDVGDPVKSSKVYCDQDADELIMLQIDRDERNIDSLIEVVARTVEHCFVPLAVGGSIQTLEDVARLIEAGADKVIVNSIAFRKPNLLTSIASRYGRQAVVVGIDVRNHGGIHFLYSNGGRDCETVTLEKHIANVISAGAGELMVQAIDHDGTMRGYALELLKYAVGISSVPVIAAGGAGNFQHIKEAFDMGISAAACGSLFNFGDNNPLRAKAFLRNYGIPLKRVS
jgi:cyclase